MARGNATLRPILETMKILLSDKKNIKKDGG